MKNFALIGTAGFVAPRHLKAINETYNNLIVALDPNDSVGILDNYFPDAYFFTEPELFERFVENLHKNNDQNDDIDYTSICSPNYLHNAHIHMALRLGTNAICEKPLTIQPENIGLLLELEQKLNKRVYTILQLRLHPEIMRLKETIDLGKGQKRKDICLTYITRRGSWYHTSWKGNDKKSGGLCMNIGVHFFDILIWLFGPVESTKLHLAQKDKVAGVLELEKARVKWFLSIDRNDLPKELQSKGRYAIRSMTINGSHVDFSNGFEGLHTKVYRNILAGKGTGIAEAIPSLEIVHLVRNCEVETPDIETAHPLLTDTFVESYI